jgi:hypothetical protein
VIVFCVGWGKLLWMIRRSKKHALLDEEKRTKIEELRRKGHTVTSRHDSGIPFGVRAIESGIQVDGIWVSRSNTPIPESLKSLQNSSRSSTSSVKSNESTKEVSLGEGFSSSDPQIEESLDTFRQSRLSLGRIVTGECLYPPEPETLLWRRTATYKPRRSSQLRYSSYADNQTNNGTLSQVEGAAAVTSSGRAYSRHSSQRAGIVLDSSSETVADSEHASGGDSDGSLSGSEGNMESNQLNPRTQSETGIQRVFKGKVRIDHKSTWSTGSIILQSTSEDFTIPLESPQLLKPSPYTTLEVSPTILSSASMRPTNRLPTTETEAIGETQWPLLSRRRDSSDHSVFMPGAIHYNKAHRTINAGFEVFPAGTFDKPNEINGSGEPSNLSVEGVASQLNQESKGKRHSKKLQKKGHDSKAGKRISMFVERF